MADVELNTRLPNESPYHASVASKLPFLRIPLEKKVNFYIITGFLVLAF